MLLLLLLLELGGVADGGAGDVPLQSTPVGNTSIVDALCAAVKKGATKKVGQKSTLSGRPGATRAAAVRQLMEADELLSRAEDAVRAILMTAADSKATREELEHHLQGAAELKRELGLLDLAALAAKERQPYLVEIGARDASISTLMDLLTRRLASTTGEGEQAGESQGQAAGGAAADVSKRSNPVKIPVRNVRFANSPVWDEGEEEVVDEPLEKTAASSRMGRRAAMQGHAAPEPTGGAVVFGDGAGGVEEVELRLDRQGQGHPLRSGASGGLGGAPSSWPRTTDRAGEAWGTLPTGTGGRTVNTGQYFYCANQSMQEETGAATGGAEGRRPPWMPSATAGGHTGVGSWNEYRAPAGSLPTASPNWTATSNPYVVDPGTLGADYYAAFPYPWNAPPVRTGGSHGDLLKIATNALVKFDGKRSNYLAWRGSFLPCVHLTTIPVNLKVMLLRSTLDTTSEDMRELASSIVFTAEGYRQAVCILEREYGGDESLLLERQEALLGLPVLREGDHQTLKMMYKRLGSFLNQWTVISGGTLSHAESITFFRQLINRLERNYAHKYIAWARENMRERGLRSFYFWLENQYENHRIMAQYTTTNLPRAQPNAAGMISNPRPRTDTYKNKPTTLPASHLDRDRKHFQYNAAAREEGKDENVVRRDPCPLCEGNHALARCFKFRELDPRDKKRFLTEKRRCYRCFWKGHGVAQCRSDYTCRHCGGPHNTALHDLEEERQSTLFAEQEEGPAGEQDTEPLITLHARVEERREAAMPSARISLRTLPIWIENPLNGRGRK